MEIDESQCREAMFEISRIAGRFTAGSGSAGNGGPPESKVVTGCRIMALPSRLRDKAAMVAVRISPVNAPLRQLYRGDVSIPEPAKLTIGSRYWGPQSRQLSVSFMEATQPELRSRIISHLNAWTATAGVSFAETAGTGEVRISRGPGGYYSYLGTDILSVPTNRQTMNLENFSMSTEESEYRRVVRHEAGHTLGFEHEHMRKALVERINPTKAYEYFARTQGWSTTDVDQQVLTALDENSIYGTPPDQDSVMCYQLPGEITYDGSPIRGGSDINASDYAYAALVYPKFYQSVLTPSTAPKQQPATSPENDWDPAEDALALA